jgi:hypothetical protein
MTGLGLRELELDLKQLGKDSEEAWGALTVQREAQV